MKRCPQCGSEYGDAAEFCQTDGQPLGSPQGSGPQGVVGSPTDPYVGQVLLGQFAIEALIGEGGMATVYRAWQRDIERPVAIKILRQEIAAVQGIVERLHREARLASRIQSPHVAHVYLTSDLPDGRHLMAMEHLEGRSLDLLIDSAGAVPQDRAVHIIRQVGEAAAEAHELGIVHRDLKPENIMLVRRGADEDFVKILDFGIAKQMGPESASLTGVGLAMGTPLYMSPEAATGAEATPASDVYAIGVIFYELLSGKVPFEGESPGRVMLQHVQEEPPPITAHPAAAQTSPGLAALVHRCLAKAASDRPSDGRAFLAALETALSSGAGAAEKPGATPAASSPTSSPAVERPPAEALALERSLGELEQVQVGTPSGGLRQPPSAAATSIRPRGRLRGIVVAVAAVAAAVVALTMLIPRGPDRLDQLVTRARQAFSAGRLEGRSGAIALTDLVLTEKSDHAAAIELREQIARSLQSEVRDAERGGDIERALARLELLEKLEPSRPNHQRRRRLERRLDGGTPRVTKTTAPTNDGARVVALYFKPTKVIAGQRVTIVARTSGPRSAFEASVFHVLGPAGDDVAIAAVRGRPDSYSARYKFPRGGRYQVGFAGYWAPLAIEEDAAPSSPPEVPDPPAPTMDGSADDPAAPAEEPQAEPEPAPAAPPDPAPEEAAP